MPLKNNQQKPIIDGNEQRGHGIPIYVCIDGEWSLLDEPSHTCQQSSQNVIFTANISVGTPPQYFKLAIDTLSNVNLIPSADCDFFCADPSNHYNSSLSSSFEAVRNENSDRVPWTVRWADVNYQGKLSNDTIHLGSHDVQGQIFEEWTSAMLATPGGIDIGYDGVLGIVPSWTWSDQGIPNILYAMEKAGNILDRNIFSLRFPRSMTDVGELLFGDTNPELYEGEPIMLPTVNRQSSEAEYRPWLDYWTLPASKISFNSPLPLHVDLSNTSYAVLDSGGPWIVLPSELARNITAAIGAEEGPWWFHSVPCSRRPYLPDLTFELGGHNFTITAFEYTMEMDIWQELGLVCLSSIWGADEFGFPGNGEWIMLGNAFLRAFYSVFDFEKQEVGSQNISHPTWPPDPSPIQYHGNSFLLKDFRAGYSAPSFLQNSLAPCRLKILGEIDEFARQQSDPYPGDSFYCGIPPCLENSLHVFGVVNSMSYSDVIDILGFLQYVLERNLFGDEVPSFDFTVCIGSLDSGRCFGPRSQPTMIRSGIVGTWSPNLSVANVTMEEALAAAVGGNQTMAGPGIEGAVQVSKRADTAELAIRNSLPDPYQVPFAPYILSISSYRPPLQRASVFVDATGFCVEQVADEAMTRHAAMSDTYPGNRFLCLAEPENGDYAIVLETLVTEVAWAFTYQEIVRFLGDLTKTALGFGNEVPSSEIEIYLKSNGPAVKVVQGSWGPRVVKTASALTSKL
ncbi:uncharacterized protein KY384_008628 [Bacidia gigantensis]|uniref:uncharacterized protein n=1 Tax=Bacidia gigantensis TaxID=2732470 RepID=UPI001D04AFAE|nr:uncharacterized protein KY384_008628 [Bacidia gigantensis]KAG8527198.1 hypothetical protein KY384_008628 [Bacidia gigantensis]